MKNLLLILAVSVCTIANAKQFEVVSNRCVNTGDRECAYHPRFMPDGNTLMVSSENYDGLGLVDISAGTYLHLTSMPGAGYETAVSEDGKTIITREVNPIEQIVNLYKINLKDMSMSPLLSEAEHINSVNLTNGEVTVSQRGMAVRCKAADAVYTLAAKKDVYVTVEDLKLVVYVNGVRSVVDPLTTEDYDAPYCWASLSPNSEKLLFVSGNDAYVSNLDGSGLVNLGLVHAPVWRDNDYVVGMADEDDGHVFTKSEIVIVKSDGTSRQQLTADDGVLKMHPSVSSDGNKIAYHTGDGKIYLMSIKEK